MKVLSTITAIPHQIEFANRQDKFLAMVGGFGSGKSQADVFRALRLLRDRDYAIICVIAPTYSLLSDVNIPDFQNTLDKYNIPYQHQKADRKFIINFGSLTGEIWFRSADRPERIVGFDLTDAIIDEFDILSIDKQKELWRKILGRLRAAPDSTLAISTTPEGFRETYRLFQKEKIGYLIRAKTTDNPFLPQDYIEALYSQYDELLVKQYINAEFVNIHGMMAYYTFSRDKINYKLSPKEIDAFPWIGIGWDFNINKMCAELFVYNESKRRIHFFDEFVMSGSFGDEPLTLRMAKAIKEKYPGKELRAYPDATGASGSTSASRTDIEIIESEGIKIYSGKSNPLVRDRLITMNTRLSDGTVTIDVDACPDLVEDLEQTGRDKYGDIDKSNPERSHSSDAAGYAVYWLLPVRHSERQSIRRSA